LSGAPKICHLQELSTRKMYQAEENIERSQINENKPYRSWLSRVIGFSMIITLTFIASFALSTNSSSSTTYSRTNIKNIMSLDAIPRNTQYTSLAEDEQHHLFDLFLKQYGRSYPKDQYNSRFQVFLENLGIADDRNADEQSSSAKLIKKDPAIHGVTKFSTFTPDELKAMKINIPRSELKDNEIPVAKISPYKGPLKAVDWTGVLTTEVKNQGLCGR
jgi:hypothetical protein